MKNALAILILMFSLSGGRAFFGQAAAYGDAEAYAVYSVVVEADWPLRSAKAKRLVIRTETADYPSYGDGSDQNCLTPAKGEEAIYGPAIAAYREANKQTLLLQPKFDVSVPVQLVPQKSIAAFFTTNGVAGWRDFYAKYPDSGGYIVMSAVGFNPDKTVAIVYMGHSCGSLCGGGRYHFLQKTDGKWHQVDWHVGTCVWAS